MTTRSAPVSLLAQLAGDARERAFATAASVEDATARYMQALDRLASGDPTGGIDAASFAAILATMGVDIERVRADVADVQRLRSTQEALDATLRGREEAHAAENAACKAWHDAVRAERDKKQAHDRAAWNTTAHDEEATRLRLLIRDQLRDVERALRDRGFTGELLTAPPAKPGPRRWRMLDRGNPQGVHLEAGSEVDFPHDYVPDPRLFVLVGPVTAESGPPLQIESPTVVEGVRDGRYVEDIGVTVRDGSGVRAPAFSGVLAADAGGGF